MRVLFFLHQLIVPLYSNAVALIQLTGDVNPANFKLSPMWLVLDSWGWGDGGGQFFETDVSDQQFLVGSKLCLLKEQTWKDLLAAVRS